MPDPDMPALDEQVLRELMASTGDDAAFVRELLDAYLADTPAQLDAVSAALRADDAAALVRPAHTLKSSSATVGAMRLSSIARQLEMTGRSGVLDPAQAGMDAARAEWDAARDALMAWLTREATP